MGRVRPERRLIDLSHAIEPGMTTYPGLPGPILSDFLSREDPRAPYAAGTTFQIARIDMVANTGTYVDAPFHRFAEGLDVGGLPLERLADLEGWSSRRDRDAPSTGTCSRDGMSREGGPAQVGGTPASARLPIPKSYVTRGASRSSRRPALVGIDSLNIDDTADGAAGAAPLLLEAGIPIVEHLRGLDALPTGLSLSLRAGAFSQESEAFRCAPTR
jgi:kynurenine formamidase